MQPCKQGNAQCQNTHRNPELHISQNGFQHLDKPNGLFTDCQKKKISNADAVEKLWLVTKNIFFYVYRNLLIFLCVHTIRKRSQPNLLRSKKITLEPTMNLKSLFLTAALALSPAALLAQSTPATTPTPGKHDYDINQRKENQQDRIANGVKSGQLTAGETAHLEKQESAINREERNMRAQDNGHLTKQDRRTIHQQQNQESRRIYRDKHNARVQ
jgi:hypothetical protein